MAILVKENGSRHCHVEGEIGGRSPRSNASKEQDLRVFFEGLVIAEKGPPPSISDESASEAEDDESEGEDGDEKKGPANGVKKSRTWVKRVRIIRDKDTQMGKGFGYVQFAVCLFLSCAWKRKDV